LGPNNNGPKAEHQMEKAQEMAQSWKYNLSTTEQKGGTAKGTQWFCWYT